jgi:acetyl esterase/lipase
LEGDHVAEYAGSGACRSAGIIAQGTADTTVRPEITKQFGDHLCSQGVRVDFVELPGVTHTFAAKDSAPAALAWMGERFRGVPAPSSCER